MGIFDSVTLDSSPRTPKGIFSYGPRNESPPSEKALVVFFQGHGRILDYGGYSIKDHIENCGMDVAELGGPLPPSDGLWVFEGQMKGSGPDFNGEYDIWWVGEFRALAEEEVTEWKEVGYLDDLWWDDHTQFENSWPCAHCGKPKQEHATPKDESSFGYVDSTLCPE